MQLSPRFMLGGVFAVGIESGELDELVVVPVGVIVAIWLLIAALAVVLAVRITG